MGVADQFDKLRSAVNHNAAVLLAANEGFWLVGNRISISLAAEFSVGALWLAFLIDFLAECLMGVVAPVGAVVLLAYLFNNTRHWAERWIGKLVALALLELLVAIELKIVMVQYQTEMGKVENLSGSGMDMVESISMLWSLGWVFLFGAVIMVALPAIAAAIGGSHVSNVVVKHITMAPAVISRALCRPAPNGSAVPVDDLCGIGHLHRTASSVARYGNDRPYSAFGPIDPECPFRGARVGQRGPM